MTPEEVSSSEIDIKKLTPEQIVEAQCRLVLHWLVTNFRSKLGIVLFPEFKEAKQKLLAAVGKARTDEILGEYFGQKYEL